MHGVPPDVRLGAHLLQQACREVTRRRHRRDAALRRLAGQFANGEILLKAGVQKAVVGGARRDQRQQPGVLRQKTIDAVEIEPREFAAMLRPRIAQHRVQLRNVKLEAVAVLSALVSQQVARKRLQHRAQPLRRHAQLLLDFTLFAAEPARQQQIDGGVVEVGA